MHKGEHGGNSIAFSFLFCPVSFSSDLTWFPSFLPIFLLWLLLFLQVYVEFLLIRIIVSHLVNNGVVKIPRFSPSCPLGQNEPTINRLSKNQILFSNYPLCSVVLMRMVLFAQPSRFRCETHNGKRALSSALFLVEEFSQTQPSIFLSEQVPASPHIISCPDCPSQFPFKWALEVKESVK